MVKSIVQPEATFVLGLCACAHPARSPQNTYLSNDEAFPAAFSSYLCTSPGCTRTHQRDNSDTIDDGRKTRGVFCRAQAAPGPHRIPRAGGRGRWSGACVMVLARPPGRCARGVALVDWLVCRLISVNRYSELSVKTNLVHLHSSDPTLVGCCCYISPSKSLDLSTPS